MTACNLNSQAPPASPVGLSTSMLTEVAATIQARLTSGADIQAATDAAASATVIPEIPGATLELPMAPIPAQSSTPTATFTLPALPITATPTASRTPLPTYTTTPIPSQTTSQSIAVPTIVNTLPAYVVSSGEGFDVKNLNIPDCGVPWAVFRIRNTSNAALESLSLYLFNVTTNKALYGPSISDTPFIDSDRVCQTGWIDQLGTGAALYASGPLSNTQKGQSIRATLTLCTKENLGGSCYQKIVEFIIP
jgi:hypothetical protein